MSRIGIVLPGFFLSGGVSIALRWAEVLVRAGHEVAVYVPEGERHSPVPALLLPRGMPCPVRSHEQAGEQELDLVLATWWETLKLLYRFRARRYALLCQALEAQFLAPGDPRQEEYRELLGAGLPVLAIAHWLARHLVRDYGVPAERVQVVLNPLDRQMFRPVPPAVPRSGRVRFLVEGSISEPRKGVREAIAVLEEVGAEYLWVGANVQRGAAGPGCAAVLERVPQAEMAAVYSSCDVLLKLSTAEGMFGPPLEMFATGGTAIAWDVWGAEEYMAHGHNCLLVPMHSLQGARRAVARLARDAALLERLRRGARATAAAWPDWDEQRGAILAAIEAVPEVAPAELFRRQLVSQAETLAALQGAKAGSLSDVRGLSLRRLLWHRLRETARSWQRPF